jgi:fatty acid desaturase
MVERMRDTPARININDWLPRDQIRALAERSTLWGVGMVLHCWLVIAAAMALVAWLPNPLTILLAIAVIGSRQLGLAILTHEGAHGGLAKDWELNLWLSQWLCAYPVFTETLSYRRYHLTHHRLTQTKDDPDLSLSAAFPTTRASLKRKVIRDLTGQTGFKQRRAQFKAALGKPGMPFGDRVRLFSAKLGRPLLVNALLAAGLAALGYWWLYPLLWIVPLLTWHMLVTRIRNIAEHALVADADAWKVARTTRANWLARAFLAPYYVNYHAEHHLMLYVPCYRLPKMHRILDAAGLKSKLEWAPDYRTVLSMAAPA